MGLLPFGIPTNGASGLAPVKGKRGEAPSHATLSDATYRRP